MPRLLSPKTLRDFEAVKKRILKPLLKPVDTAHIRQLMKTLRRDGSWPDIDYKDMSTVNWRPIQHLSRLLLIARAYRAPASDLRGDAALKKTASKALDYWLKHDYRRPWWYEEIGTPSVMSQILLLLDEDLTEVQRAGGIDILKRSRLTATGQNLVWLSSIVANRGILEKDPQLVATAYRYIAGEIKISTKEGIQPDFSFHQHGPCLYNHGYGAGFAGNCAELAARIADTQFAFPAEKIDILTRYILDGSQWLARGSTPEYGAKGREITRRGSNVRYLASASRNMCKLPTGREEEFRALVKRASGGSAPPLVGNRHFWCSDIMTHHRKAYYTSARMYAVRNVNTDGLSGCEEGLKSHYIADGANFVYRTGKEYIDIFPVLDWQKIPGTTVELGPERSGEPRRKGTTTFVGGVSDGMYGLAAFDFEQDGLTARKSWCFFDAEYVCLGAGITCKSGNPVVTTLNQCHLKGSVTASDGGKRRRLSRGEHVLQNPAWLYHDKIAYIFPQATDLYVRNDAQSGSWKLISNQSSDEPSTHDIFKAWIDHGQDPENATYAYVVAPGMPVSAVSAYAGKPDVEILSNDPNLQAVRHKKLKITGIAFYKPGALKLSRNLEVGVDRACLVLVRELRGKLAISVSNPRNKKLTVRVNVNRELKGKTETQITFDLPGGMAAGQIITQVVNL